MKNREFRTLIAAVMLTTLVAGSVGTTPAYVFAAEGNAKVSTEQKDAKTEKSDKEESSKNTESTSAKPTKNETVYAKIDGSGAVTEVTVSDQLKNISDVSSLQDVSELSDIENVKGDETFTTSGKNLTWNTEGSDICYQGKTDKALPVGVKISYKLDGKDISASDLEGKSGHLVIRYTYENTSEKTNNGTKVPFMMASGLLMDTDRVSNVVVKNGKIISDGDRDMVIGYGFPGMTEILGTTDLDIPDYFEVEMDVTDYEAIEGITVATNSLFNDLGDKENDSKLDDLEGLQDSMNELQDAANQLVDGTGQLKDGLDTLLASSGTLTDGIGQLATGSKTLADGTKSLASGTGNWYQEVKHLQVEQVY